MMDGGAGYEFMGGMSMAVKRDILVRLTHTGAKWIERALTHIQQQAEDNRNNAAVHNLDFCYQIAKLDADNMQDLLDHINDAVHRAVKRRK